MTLIVAFTTILKPISQKAFKLNALNKCKFPNVLLKFAFIPTVYITINKRESAFPS